MRKKVEYIFIRLLYEVLRIIPLKISETLAVFLALILQYVIRYRREVIQNNLKNAMPELSTKEKKVIIRQVYKNFFMLWIEFLQGGRLSKKYIEKNITAHNWEIVEQAIKEGKGIIFISGHLGNYEWLGHYFALTIGNIYAIQKRIKNPYVNDFIVKIREKHGLKLIYNDNAIKNSLSVLKNSKFLGIVGDQDFGRRGIFVNFFNIPASTAMGPAVLHLRTGAAMIMCMTIRKSLGKFDFYFEQIPDVKSQEMCDQNIQLLTQAHTNILEKYIRRFPGQWLWSHRRWRTRPKS